MHIRQDLPPPYTTHLIQREMAKMAWMYHVPESQTRDDHLKYLNLYLNV